MFEFITDSCAIAINMHQAGFNMIAQEGWRQFSLARRGSRR